MKIIDWDGKPITRPGVYSNVSLEAYHSQRICDAPSVSSTNLRRVLERNAGSPAHFWHEWTGNPNCAESEEQPHLVFGRAVHHLMLGETFFSAQFVIREKEHPEWENWRTKASQEWRKKVIVDGRSVLTAADIEDIRGISNAIAAHRYGTGKWLISELLTGRIEKSFFWRDKKTGFWCKSRPDAIPTASGDYADLKTTTSVSYQSLQRTISDFAYHQQAAMVSEGSKHAADIEMSSYSLVFVEKKPPHCVRRVPMDMEDIQIGYEQNRIALDLIAQCYREKRWPGPGEDHTVSIPLSPLYRAAAKRDIDQYQREQEQAA